MEEKEKRCEPVFLTQEVEITPELAEDFREELEALIVSIFDSSQFSV